MNLSISNIAWNSENDNAVYTMMKEYGFTGLEIAPTRIFPNEPYGQLDAAKNWLQELNRVYGFTVPSMQSIWFGKTERIFASEEERAILIQYTKQAVDFAETIGCKNLVFGCPRNRTISENMAPTEVYNVAVKFFKELGDYAALHNTVIGMEANPPIYNTNFINTTASAFDLISKVDSKGFRLNLDVGTMIYNNESVEILADKIHLINHVHISEPYLKLIQKRNLHKDLISKLSKADYNGYISIEMGKVECIKELQNTMEYVGGLVL